MDYLPQIPKLPNNHLSGEVKNCLRLLYLKRFKLFENLFLEGVSSLIIESLEQNSEDDDSLLRELKSAAPISIYDYKEYNINILVETGLVKSVTSDKNDKIVFEENKFYLLGLFQIYPYLSGSEESSFLFIITDHVGWKSRYAVFPIYKFKEQFELHIKKIKKHLVGRKRFLDIGTGAGSYSIFLKNYFCDVDEIEIWALDSNKRALELAKINECINFSKKTIKFIHAQIKNFHPTVSFDMVISNPPFI